MVRSDGIQHPDSSGERVIELSLTYVERRSHHHIQADPFVLVSHLKVFRYIFFGNSYCHISCFGNGFYSPIYCFVVNVKLKGNAWVLLHLAAESGYVFKQRPFASFFEAAGWLLAIAFCLAFAHRVLLCLGCARVL